jgi:hypothetical protein
MNKEISNLTLALIAISSFLSLSAAEVETATYCSTIGFSGPGLKDNATLPLFDPGIGSLVRVDLAADLGILENISLENEENVSQTVDAQSEATLLITMPDSSSISVNASSSMSEELAAYDGKTDFAGQSGKTIEGVTSKGSAEEKYLELTDFVASFQNETISLPAAISLSSKTSGTIVFSKSTDAESKICVTYTYEPRVSGAREKGDSK